MNGLMSEKAKRIADYYESRYESPQDAWTMAIGARRTGKHEFNPQALADAEHYLWAKHNASKSYPHAMAGLILPLGYSAYKSGRQLLGMDTGSVPTLDQLGAGQRGALEGFARQWFRNAMGL